MSTIDYLFKNAHVVDAKWAEDGARIKYPLLLHDDEVVELAFRDRAGKGRDKFYFTNQRILLKDGKGIGHARRNYHSVPYTSICAFSIDTAGQVLDGDTKLQVWTSGWPTTWISFSSKQVDIFYLQEFLNAKVAWVNSSKSFTMADVNAQAGETPSYAPSEEHVGQLGSFMDWMGDNASAISTEVVATKLKTNLPVLLPEERIDLAYKSGLNGRDLTVFTDRRLLLVNGQGLFGKKVSYLSIDWDCVSGFCVESAGAHLDRDSDFTLYFNILGIDKIKQDFRKTSANLLQVQAYLAAQVLDQVDETHPPNLASFNMPVDRKEGHVDPKGNWWFRENQRPLDAVEMESYYKTSVPILQTNEVVEFAFKGRRDITLMTTKRLIEIDPKGLSGTRIAYKSIPWSRVLAFGVKTAGALDWDNEIRLWTDMYYKPQGGEDDPPEPRMSYREIEFNKDMVDVMMLKKYLSLRLLQKGTRPLNIPASAMQVSAKEVGFEKFISKLGGDSRAIDHSGLNQELHTSLPLLLDEEHICMAFKAGRDVTVFTNLRVMHIDVRGITGKKIAYDSIPYSSIRGFSTESAGDFDLDSELKLYTYNRWDFGKLAFDFRKGKADIMLMQKFLSAILMGTPEEAEEYFQSREPVTPKRDPAAMEHWLVWLANFSEETDHKAMDLKLHYDTPVLLEHERVLKCFKQARDYYVYTTHRVLEINVQGVLGKKVQYKSFPLDQIKGFAIETAGHLDWDAELYLHLNIPHKKSVKQSIRTKNFDIMIMNKYWTDWLFSKTA